MMGKKTPPLPEYPLWTTAKFFGWLRSGLRRMWLRYPARREALEDACVGRRKNKKTGKQAKHFRCCECGELFVQKDVQVDHKIEVGSLRSWEDVGDFVRRLFCHKDELQVMCKECHKNKTN